MQNHPPFDTQPAMVSAMGEGETYWFGSATARQVAIIRARGGSTGLTLTEMHAPQGSVQPLHLHESHDDNFLILEGSLTFYCDGTVFSAGVGTYVSLPRGVPHSFRVVDGPAHILGMYTNEDFANFITATSDPVEPSDPFPSTAFDIARAEQIAPRYGMKILGPPPAELMGED
jgi:quercetin dioxygenase-like cupin family protein